MITASQTTSHQGRRRARPVQRLSRPPRPLLIGPSSSLSRLPSIPPWANCGLQQQAGCLLIERRLPAPLPPKSTPDRSLFFPLSLRPFYSAPIEDPSTTVTPYISGLLTARISSGLHLYSSNSVRPLLFGFSTWPRKVHACCTVYCLDIYASL